MTISRTLVCVAAAIVASVGGFAQEKPAQSTTARIQKKSYDFKEAGKSMDYALFVPSTYDNSKPHALMVALHGLGSNPQQIIRYPQLTDLAEKHGYIVVAPMGYNSQGWYGNKPPFGRKPDPENLFELSEKDVMNVLGIIRKEFNVDAKRIYLMGHSMGGGGTLHLGIKYPELWAGLAPIAPAIFAPVSTLEKAKHIPVILVQGAKDNLVRADRVRPWAEKMKELKMTHQYVELPEGDHINVIREMPKIFEFFNKHQKSEKGGEK